MAIGRASSPGSPRFRLLEADAGAQLNLPTRRRGFGDTAEARCVDETVWCAEIGVIQRVEKLSAHLESCFFSQCKLAHYCNVQCLQSGPVNRVSAHVAVCISRRGGKRAGVEPCS